MTEVPPHLLNRSAERRHAIESAHATPMLTPEQIHLTNIIAAFGVYEAARNDFLSVCMVPEDRYDLRHANGSAFGMLQEAIENAAQSMPRQQG